MNSPAGNRLEQAFSRIDLIAAILVSGILLGLAGSSFARSDIGSAAAECLSNKKRLMTAWTAFAADNNGTLPGVSIGPPNQAATPNLPNQPWVTGWLTWDTSAHNTNTVYLTDRRYSSLAPFLNGDSSAFRCPSDISVSAAQASRGWTRRARSVSGGSGIGPGDQVFIDASYHVHVTNLSGFLNPPPGDAWVFLDEHPDSINDPAFIAPSGSQTWSDLPSSFHSRGCAFGFADGRAEVHRWANPAMSQPVRFSIPQPPPGGADALWVRERAPHR